MGRRARALPALLLVWIPAAGCATHRHLSPRAVDVRLEEGERLPSSGTATVVAGAVGEPAGNRIGIFGGSTVRLDYAEFSADLVRILEGALVELGVATSDDADRSLEVSVRHVNFALGGLSGLGDRYDCFVDVATTTSEGYVRGFVGTAGSRSYAKSCNHALAKVARAILLDPGIWEFLEGP